VGRDPANRPGTRETRQSPQFLARVAVDRGDQVE